jgi:hypothetical protein
MTRLSSLRATEPVPDEATASLHEQVDQLVEAGFSRWEVTATERCSDAEFIRRITLDLKGTIPTAEATAAFIADASPTKRIELIDRLLADESFARRMAVAFDVTLMERRPDKYVTSDEWRDWLQTAFTENRPLNATVAQILSANEIDDDGRRAAKFYLDRAVDKDVLVRDIGRLFLGVDLQCAQCHDHPDFSDYKHEHYYGLSVFVTGSKTFKLPNGKMALQETLTREAEFASVFAPEDTRKTGPRLLAGDVLEIPEFPEGEEYVEKPTSKVRSVPKFSLRELLATKLTGGETPAFARNMANRLWAMMMGRGIVHPLDAHHVANPPSHPELLAALAKSFQESEFDTRGFVRELVLSETYQRSSIAPSEVDPSTIAAESFAVANMKGLSPEQLLHSLLEATSSHAVFEKQIEDALMEDAEAWAELSADAEKLDAARDAKKAERVKEFITLFGSTPGRPEGEFQASVTQTLFLANNPALVEWLEPRDNNLTARIVALDDASDVGEMAYLSVLSRQPEAEEISLLKEHLQSRDNREAAIVEFVWSLIASAEFRLNH